MSGGRRTAAWTAAAVMVAALGSVLAGCGTTGGDDGEAQPADLPAVVWSPEGAEGLLVPHSPYTGEVIWPWGTTVDSEGNRFRWFNIYSDPAAGGPPARDQLDALVDRTMVRLDRNDRAVFAVLQDLRRAQAAHRGEAGTYAGDLAVLAGAAEALGLDTDPAEVAAGPVAGYRVALVPRTEAGRADLARTYLLAAVPESPGVSGSATFTASPAGVFLAAGTRAWVMEVHPGDRPGAGWTRVAPALEPDEPELPPMPDLETAMSEQGLRDRLVLLTHAIESFAAEQGAPPQGGHDDLVTVLRATGAYDLEADPMFLRGRLRDPWGNALHYQAEGAAWTLYSYGPDGVDQGGGGDDVVVR